MLSWVADRAARHRLRDVVRDVPAGVVVSAGNDSPVRFPHEVVVRVTPSSAIAASGGFGLRAPTPGVAFEFRRRDGGTTTWVAPLVTHDGLPIHPADAEALASEVTALLGTHGPG